MDVAPKLICSRKLCFITYFFSVRKSYGIKKVYRGIEGKNVKAYLLFPGGSTWQTIHYQVDSAVTAKLTIHFQIPHHEDERSKHADMLPLVFLSRKPRDAQTARQHRRSSTIVHTIFLYDYINNSKLQFFTICTICTN